MADFEPMTDEELAGAKERAQKAQAAIQTKYPNADLLAWYWLATSPWDEVSASYCLYLVAEVERQRTIHDEAWDLIDRLSEDLADHAPLAHDWLLDEANAWRAKHPKTKRQ